MCKICKQCKTEYCGEISDNFYQRKLNTDGFQKYCKRCLLAKGHKLKHFDEQNQLICAKCLIYLSEDSFDINKNGRWFRNFKDRRCKSCKKKQYEKRRVESRGSGIERLVVERYCSIRERAKKNGWIVDFDKDYLLELWEKQNHLCALTKIEMTALLFNGRTPTNMSVDRIDSTKGYTKDNIQLVCMAVNQMKSDLTYSELLFFCKNIVEHEKKD